MLITIMKGLQTAIMNISNRANNRHLAALGSTNINSIPHDMITEILGHVAASSITDLCNAKQSCKILNKASEDKHVYQHVSVENCPYIWSTEALSFLKRCKQYENLEALYMLGMMEFFAQCQLDTGLALLEKAANLGHTKATYVLGIILLLDDADESRRDRGMQLLNHIMSVCKKSGNGQTILECRRSSKKVLRGSWINTSLFGPLHPPTCTCSKGYRERGWSTEEDSFDVLECEACQRDLELKIFYNMLHGV